MHLLLFLKIFSFCYIHPLDSRSIGLTWLYDAMVTVIAVVHGRCRHHAWKQYDITACTHICWNSPSASAIQIRPWRLKASGWYDNLPHASGRSLVWDATVMDMSVLMNVEAAATGVSSASTKAEAIKRRRFVTLVEARIFGHSQFKLRTLSYYINLRLVPFSP